MSQACISQWAIARPVANPAPARPTRCSEPMFEVKMEVPMVVHLASRAERKYPAPSCTFLRTEAQTMAIMARKKRVIATQSAELKMAPLFMTLVSLVG